jgi:hypothetical protein
MRLRHIEKLCSRPILLYISACLCESIMKFQTQGSYLHHAPHLIHCSVTLVLAYINPVHIMPFPNAKLVNDLPIIQ